MLPSHMTWEIEIFSMWSNILLIPTTILKWGWFDTHLNWINLVAMRESNSIITLEYPFSMIKLSHVRIVCNLDSKNEQAPMNALNWPSPFLTRLPIAASFPKLQTALSQFDLMYKIRSLWATTPSTTTSSLHKKTLSDHQGLMNEFFGKSFVALPTYFEIWKTVFFVKSQEVYPFQLTL